MDQGDRVAAGRHLLETESAISWRHLEPGMIEDINPGAHAAVKHAAQPDRILEAAGTFERVGEILAAGDVDVKRFAAIGSHHVMKGLIAVADANEVAGPDS